MVSIDYTIRNVGPAEWNRLAAGNAFASHGWLLTMEMCWRARVEPLYFALWRRRTLCAAAVCYATESSPGIETLDDMLLGRLVLWAPWFGLGFLPALVCGPAQGYGWHIGVDPEVSEAEQNKFRRDLLQAIESEADRRRLPLTFTQVLDEETELRELLVEKHYLSSTNVPIARLDVTWGTMDDYYAHLPGRRRRKFRRESQRCAEAGVEIELSDSCEGMESQLFELLEEHPRRHGPIGTPFRPEVFSELSRNMGADALWFIARKAGRATGVCLALRKENRLVAFAVGVDRKASRSDFTYFQIGFYGLIEHAVQQGIGSIDYGRGMYPIKTLRGCRLIGSSIYARQTGPRRLIRSLWFPIASLWNRYKLPSKIRQQIKIGNLKDGEVKRRGAN